MPEKDGCSLTSAIAAICPLIQVACAISIILILPLHLTNQNGVKCLLDGYDGLSSYAICNYAYALGSFSLLAGLVVFLLQIVTSFCCKVRMIGDSLAQFLARLFASSNAL